MRLVSLIQSDDLGTRNRALVRACEGLSFEELHREIASLERFRTETDNLYQRVRALFFLYAIYRFVLPLRAELPCNGRIPYDGYAKLLERRFEEAIARFRQTIATDGPSDGLCSALAAGYYALAFQTLAGQVRRSVRGVPGNRWMFRVGHPAEVPLRIRPELLVRGGDGAFPILREQTPVRMDLSHSCWSDIFFLGMDYPEGARVLNISIDLGVHGRDASPRPPIDVYLRVIDEPVLRLASVDLDCRADIVDLAEMFDFGRDYLGLLKAALIASGLVPPGLEGSHRKLTDLLGTVIGPGLGLEVVSCVNDIPKGSRLAVSTNLLAGLISACMRATGQARSLTGGLTEEERRLVAARAILGEWIGGSGGGWQDSGGVWPGIKCIEGAQANPGDPEFGISRGRLLPRHTVLGHDSVSEDVRQRLQDSLILVHGGMAQNVGPILEMCTEKYLLRGESEWQARQNALAIFDSIVQHLQAGDIQHLAAETTRNFREPIQTIIPWASNDFTERLIQRTRQSLGQHFWGFWMLGGMSGGGMGFIVDPSKKQDALKLLQQHMADLRQELVHALPFAMEPVVYDFAINNHGTHAQLLKGPGALLAPGYYALSTPHWLRRDLRELPATVRGELARLGAASKSRPELTETVTKIFDRLLPRAEKQAEQSEKLEELLHANGFDREQHERIRADMKRGLIGLAQNHLPATARIEDVLPGDVWDTRPGIPAAAKTLGEAALRAGEAMVVTLAAGAGSRWTQGAGVVKALHPFAKFAGMHRTFLEVHLAKARKTAANFGTCPPIAFTTGYLTHEPIALHLHRHSNYAYQGPLVLSPGRGVGLRMVPMVRDLRFFWEETAHQQLDEQKQKVRERRRCWRGHAKPAKPATTPTILPCSACTRPGIGTNCPICSGTAR
jgi:hypothetical protein